MPDYITTRNHLVTDGRGRSCWWLMRVNVDDRAFYEFAVSNWRADGIAADLAPPYPQVTAWHRPSLWRRALGVLP